MSIARCFAIAVSVVIALTSYSNGEILYVSPCGDDDWTGIDSSCAAGPLGPKCTIQAAITAAASGDQIRILSGVYRGPLDTQGKAIHLWGVSGPTLTVVREQGVVCDDAEGPLTIVEGLRFAQCLSSDDGGAIRLELASPTFRDCVIEGNYTHHRGGGVALHGGSPTFERCVVRNNFAGDDGGGVWISGAGEATFVDCTFAQNVTNGYGGGLGSEDSVLTLVSCVLSGNDAEYGGGLYAIGSSVDLESSDFRFNIAGDLGPSIAG